MKRIFYLYFACLVACLVMGCSDHDEDKTEPAQLIGVSLASATNGYMDAVVMKLQGDFKSKGYTLLVTNADGKIETQKTQIKALLNRGIKALIIVSPEGDLSEETVLVKKSGMPLLNMINLFEDKNLADVYIANDDRQSGEILAEEINTLLVNGGKYQVLYKTGDVSESVRVECIDGLKDNLEASVSQFSNPLACVDLLSATQRAKQILSRDVEVCVAFDDISAQGFVTAMAEMGKTLNDVHILVLSGSPESKQLLKNGKISAVIARSPISLAAAVVEGCLKRINRELVEKYILIENKTLTVTNIGDSDSGRWE